VSNLPPKYGTNKVTLRSYGHFLKFSYFYFLRNWFSQLCQKLQSLVQKTQGISGINSLCTKFSKVPCLINFHSTILRFSNTWSFYSNSTKFVMDGFLYQNPLFKYYPQDIVDTLIIPCCCSSTMALNKPYRWYLVTNNLYKILFKVFIFGISIFGISIFDTRTTMRPWLSYPDGNNLSMPWTPI
jgi:hypothetical protein